MIKDYDENNENLNFLDERSSPSFAYKNKPLEWKKILMQDDFFYLYFNYMGINESLSVEHLTDFYEIQRNKRNEIFHFAIIKTKKVKNQNQNQNENLLIHDKEESNKISIDLINKNKLIIFYPDDCEDNETDNNKNNITDKESDNFLSLAYSGFINSNSTKLFNTNNNPLNNFIKELNSIFNLPNVNFSDFDSNNNFFKRNNNLFTSHNNFIENLCENRIDKIYKANLHTQAAENKKTETSYSLFFIKDDKLFEFRTEEREIIMVSKFVNNINAREVVLEHIVSNIDSKVIDYLNDVTVFNEETEKQENNQNLNIKSEGTLVVFLITFLFIINFLIINPGSIFFNLSQTFIEFFERDINRVSFIDGNINSVLDLKNYFNKNIIGKIYNSTQNNFNYNLWNITANSNITNINSTNYYYLLNSNFYCGMMLNFKVFSELNATDYHNENVKIPNSTLKYYGSKPNGGNNPLDPEEIVSSENPLYPDTFKLYFKPNMSHYEIDLLRDQFNLIFVNQLFEFSYTIIIYNNNYNAVITYSVNFVLNTSGEITYTRYIQGFLPFLMESIETFLLLWIINILYMICFIYLSFPVVRNFSDGFYDMFKSKINTLQWQDLFNILVLLFSFVSQIISYQLIIFNSEAFPIPLNSEDEFIYWIEHLLNMKTYTRITGLAMFFFVMRLIKVLYASFPSFGIVFNTLKMASKEIITFSFIVGFMLMLISVMAHISFGWYSPNYKYLESSEINIFLFFFGKFKYQDFVNSNDYNLIAPFFVVFSLSFFNLIIIQVFLCILRNTYSQWKEKSQILNESMSMIKEDKNAKFRKKLYNFLFCGVPVELQEGDNDKENNIFDNSTHKFEKLEQGFKNNFNDNEENNFQQINKTSMPLWQRMKLNFDRINLKSFFRDKNFLDKEVLDKKLSEKYKEIYRNNLLESISDIECDYDSEFNQLIDFFIYILYIICFVVVIFFQLKFSQSQLIEKYVTNYFMNELVGKNLYFDSWDGIRNNLNNFLKKSYNYSSSDDCNNAEFSPNSIRYYKYLSPPYFRLTFRLLNYVNNTTPYESEYFPKIIIDNTPLDENNCQSPSEKLSDFSVELDDEVYKGKLRLKYSPGTVSNIQDGCGGYVYLANTTCPFCIKDPKHNLNIISHFYFSIPVGSVNFDMILFHLYYDYIIYINFSFIKDTLGNINYYPVVFPIPINKYINLTDLLRLIFEISFVFLTLYYLHKESCVVFQELKNLFIQDYNNSNEKDNFKKSTLINKFFRFDKNNFINYSLFKLLGYMIYFIFEKIIVIVFYFVVAIYKYLALDFFNIIDILSLSMSIQLFNNWLKITLKTNQINFNNSDNVSGTEYNIQIASELASEYYDYIFLLSLNSFIIIFRFFQYFKFSKSIFTLISIIRKNKNAIFFHLIFVFLVNLGFCLMGYALFGQNVETYSKPSKVFLDLLIMLSGTISYDVLKSADNKWATIYIALFLLYNSLILFNLLAAIIVEGYREAKTREQQNISNLKKLNFFSNVINIIKNKQILFFNRCELFYNNTLNLLHEVDKNCNYILEKNLFEINSDSNRNSIGGYYEKIKEIFLLEKAYLSDISNKIENCEKVTADGEYYIGSNLLYSEEEVLKHNLIRNYFKDKVISCDEITIFQKISFYISDLIGENIFEIYNKEKKENQKNNNINLEFLNKQTFHENKTFNLKEEKLLTDSTYKSNKLSNKKASFWIRKFNKSNSWLVELKLLYNKLNLKNSSFLSSNLLDKPSDFRISKMNKTQKELKSLNQIYEIEEVNYDNNFNINYSLPCSEYPQCIQNKNFCKNCDFIRDYYKSIEILIYDIFIIYFHIQSNLKTEDRELIFGHNFLQLRKNHIGEMDNNIKNTKLIQLISNQIIKNFEKDILKINNLSKMEIIKISDLNTITDINDINDIKDNNGNDTLDNENKLDYFKNLNKFFTIWNTIYLILYKKNNDHVLKIKELSYSYKLYKEFTHTNKSKYKNYCQQIVNLFFNLDRNLSKSDRDSKLDKIFGNEVILDLDMKITYADYIKKVMAYLKKEEHLILEYDNYANNLAFYLDKENYLFESDKNTLYKYMYPKYKDKNNANYNPEILKKLWDTLNRLEKFFIFFGYNKYLADEAKFDIFLKNGFQDENKINFKIQNLFTSVHRATILQILEFPEFFDILLINKLKEFLELNKIDDDFLSNFKTGIEVLNYFNNKKINYVMYYDFITNVFENCFKEIKIIVHTNSFEFHKTLKLILNPNSTYFEFSGNKIEFIKLFKLYLTLKNFHKINSHFDNLEEVNQIKSDDEREEINFRQKELDDKIFDRKTFLKYEVFIFACSMDPLELLNVIKFMDDNLFKEFYMLLFIFLHHNDSDYSYCVKYLKKNVKVAIYDKYNKYTDYLTQRGKIIKLQEAIIREENLNENTIKYIKDIASRLEEMEEVRSKLLNTISNRINKEENKNNKDI